MREVEDDDEDDDDDDRARVYGDHVPEEGGREGGVGRMRKLPRRQLSSEVWRDGRVRYLGTGGGGEVCCNHGNTQVCQIAGDCFVGAKK